MPYNIGDARNKTFGENRIPPEKIIAWIEDNFEYKTRKNKQEYLINNPLTYDKGFHFNINPYKGKCHDWRGDEWAGSINPATNSRNCSFIKFVRLYRKCSYAEAIKEIVGTKVDIRHYLMPKHRVTDEAYQNKFSVKLPEGVVPIIESDDTTIRILLKWLNSRGYTNEQVVKHNLQYLGMNVYWPYFEFDSLVYWQSRSRLNKRFEFPSLEVYDDNNKLIGQTDGSKGDFLYGFDDVEQASYLILTEAIFDQHTLGEQALASGGAVITSKQLNKIKVLGPKKGVILSPDRDIAGLESILSNYNMLSQAGFNVYYSIPPDIKYLDSDKNQQNVKDWNELGMHACGFSKVRNIHDKNIKRLNTAEQVKLNEMIARMKRDKKKVL